MPIIAGRASAAYGAGFGRVIAGAPVVPVGAYDSLATVSLSSNTSSITFSGIPSGYKHLQIRAIHRGTVGAGDGTVYMTFNGDSSGSSTAYSSHRMYGYGSTVGADNSVNSSSAQVGQSMGATPSVQSFSVMITDILDYSNLSKNKTIRSLAGTDTNSSGSGAVFFNGSAWYNLSAINSITIVNNQTAFATNSHFALYGVK